MHAIQAFQDVVFPDLENIYTYESSPIPGRLIGVAYPLQPRKGLVRPEEIPAYSLKYLFNIPKCFHSRETMLYVEGVGGRKKVHLICGQSDRCDFSNVDDVTMGSPLSTFLTESERDDISELFASVDVRSGVSLDLHSAEKAEILTSRAKVSEFSGPLQDETFRGPQAVPRSPRITDTPRIAKRRRSELGPSPLGSSEAGRDKTGRYNTTRLTTPHPFIAVTCIDIQGFLIYARATVRAPPSMLKYPLALRVMYCIEKPVALLTRLQDSCRRLAQPHGDETNKRSSFLFGRDELTLDAVIDVRELMESQACSIRGAFTWIMPQNRLVAFHQNSFVGTHLLTYAIDSMPNQPLLQYSILERTLLGASAEEIPVASDTSWVFIQKFFESWPAETLIQLGKTNTTLRQLVSRYIARRWDVHLFLSKWFYKPSTILDAMEVSDTLICGVAVTRFFYECADTQDPLEICATPEHIERLASILYREGYRFSGVTHGIDLTTALKAVLESYNPAGELRTAECAIDPTNHQAHFFLFKEGGSDFCALASHGRRVIIRLVRFGGDHVFSDRSSEHWLLSRPGSNMPRVSIISGPPTEKRTFAEIKLGSRWIGDDTGLPSPSDWNTEPRFEVLDFRSGVHRPGSYLLIGEPFIFRLESGNSPKSSNSSSLHMEAAPNRLLIVGRRPIGSVLSDASMLVEHPSSDYPFYKAIDDNSHTTTTKCVVFHTTGGLPWSQTVARLDADMQYALDLRTYFPFGSASVRIVTFSSDIKRAPSSQYRLFFSNQLRAEPHNACVMGLYELPWAGNVVVARYSRGERGENTFVNLEKTSDFYCAAILTGV
ncbi:hypothetical protein DFP72DRAFT_851137 [Ephemerocybe angulata]|uniref:Uncharacterized protein n=1 Tax=Ephemerocybe angulata TaxID=980116 RepID=A0A8H6M0R9_9AGAR|nr:hypothetical protein DFP72DRAFT_851137 [Tulosesus angulatus]